MKFTNSIREFYMYTLIESLKTDIGCNPTQVKQNEFEETFKYNNITYKIDAYIIPSINGYNNILICGFNNITKNTNYDNEHLTNDAASPVAIFGIILNWISRFVNMHDNIEHIVFTSKNYNDTTEYDKRSHLYYKLVDRFLTIRSDFIRDETLDKFKLPPPFNQHQYTIFAVSKRK